MEFASNAKGNAGLTLGIIGTSLAGLLGLGAIGNRGFGLFNTSNGVVAESGVIAGMAAEIARLNATAYANEVGIGVYKELIQQSNTNDAKLAALSDKLAQGIINLDKKVATIEAQAPLMFKLSEVNSERYTDQKTCKKLDGELRIPYQDICYPSYPQVAQPVYWNPWYNNTWANIANNNGCGCQAQ